MIPLSQIYKREKIILTIKNSKDLIKERDRGMTAEHTRVYRRATTFLDKELYGKSK